MSDTNRAIHVSTLTSNTGLYGLLDFDSRPALSSTGPRAAESSPAEVIDRARRGDREALSSLLRELQDPWYRLSLGLLRDADLAAEAVQETGLRFLRQIAGFRGDSQIRTWSLGIAINVARELKRKRARHGSAASLDGDLIERAGTPGPTAWERTEAGAQADALRLVLADLPERQREAVLLRFFEELSVEETAKLMGCAAGTVKATVHQALRSLRKRLRQWV